jgi:hypothetical protein
MLWVTLLTKIIFRRLTTAKKLLKLIELPDLLLRVSRQFKMALTDLQTAIKSLRGMLANLMFQTLADPSDVVTVDDRGAVTVDDKDLESILEHATNCLEQTSLLYKVSMDENDRRIAKSKRICTAGGAAVVAGGASWWFASASILGTLAAIAGALACVGAGYLYLNSDYRKSPKIEFILTTYSSSSSETRSEVGHAPPSDLVSCESALCVEKWHC